MILAWLAAAVATAVVAGVVLALATDVRPGTWPAEEPLHLRDERAHDLRLTHLRRLLGARDPAVLHAEVVAVVDDLLATSTVAAGPAGTDPRAVLTPEARRFLADPPLGSADAYRRRLAAVLDDLEAL